MRRRIFGGFCTVVLAPEQLADLARRLGHGVGASAPAPGAPGGRSSRKASRRLGVEDIAMRFGLAVIATAVGLAGTTAARAADALDSVLLLGLHVEPIEGYEPMFSEQGR